MKFDDMKKQFKEVKAPEIKFKPTGKENPGKKENTMTTITLNGFVEKLKTQDEKDKKMSRGFMITLCILTVIYTGLFLVNPDPDLTLYHRIGGGLLVAAFILFILHLKKKLSGFEKISYQSPTNQFLGEAEKRMRFLSKKHAWILYPYLLLIDAAECLFILARYWGPERETGRGLMIILIVNVVYFGVLGIVYIFARKKWKKEKEPLLQKIRQMKQDLSTDI